MSKDEHFSHGNSKTLTSAEQDWVKAILVRATSKEGVRSPESGAQIQGVSALATEIGVSKLALLGAACGLGVAKATHKLVSMYVASFAKAAQPAAETAQA